MFQERGWLVGWIFLKLPASVKMNFLPLFSERASHVFLNSVDLTETRSVTDELKTPMTVAFPKEKNIPERAEC